MLNIQKFTKEMYGIVEKILEAQKNISVVLEELDDLDSRYQKAQLTYKKYINLKNKILLDRTRDEAINSYTNYIKNLQAQLIRLNSKILLAVDSDKSYEKLKIGKVIKTSFITLPKLEELEIADFEPPFIEEIPHDEIVLPKVPVHETFEESKITDLKAKIPEPQIPEPPIEDLVPEVTVKPSRKPIPVPPKPVPLQPPRSDFGFFDRLGYAVFSKQKPWLEPDESSVAFGGLFSKAFLKYLFTGEKKSKVFGATSILPSILSYEDKQYEKDLVTKSDLLDPYLLEKQIKEIKTLISRKKPDVYKASTIGYLANVSVRKISIYFIEKYPELFKKLYMAVRHANIKILANTYINIIFFLAMVVGALSMPILTVLFTMSGNPPGWVIVKVILGTIFLTNLMFWLGFYYPFVASKSRRRSINTNLPFAIDHMSSVIASGVSPATMFKLISNSSEYGEISIELEKVTNYIDFFGYDILTALKAVALTTPAEDFKEFIDGFVSTIETGGDLKEYLQQKSSEALMNYRLERQKYVESLSTYSDIYTGVLIAAPLFFVTALSLVSVIGSDIGGLSVSTILTLGTYLIIPGLNLLFIVFLEINQPEI